MSALGDVAGSDGPVEIARGLIRRGYPDSTVLTYVNGRYDTRWTMRDIIRIKRDFFGASTQADRTARAIAKLTPPDYIWQDIHGPKAIKAASDKLRDKVRAYWRARGVSLPEWEEAA